MKIAGIQYCAGADWRANLSQLDAMLDQVRFMAPDVLVLPDGSLLVSDDHAGAIYRITYSQARRP